MSDMSLLDTSSMERGKGSKASPAGGQHTPKHMSAETNTQSFLNCTFLMNILSEFDKKALY